ncbi:MAG: hypothetical protein AB1798_04280 [Spirochaetota bacterium]
MVHRITLSSNPKVVVIFFILIALPVAAILAFLIVGILGGIIAVVISAYLDFQIIRFLRASLESRVETNKESICFNMGNNERQEFGWTEITHAGLCLKQGEKPQIFVYNENDDKLICIPKEFSSFDNLLETVKLQTGDKFEEFILEKGETLQDKLINALGLKGKEY